MTPERSNGDDQGVDELAKAHASLVAIQSIQRIAGLYRIEQEAREMLAADRLALRRLHAQPLWNELHVWLRLERTRVADGGGIAAALDYSLKRWGALGRFLVSVVSVPSIFAEGWCAG